MMQSTYSILASRNSLVGALAMAAQLAMASGCGDTSAAVEANGSEQAPAQKEPAPAAATVELGEISIAQVRPLENSMLIVRFDAHAAASGAGAEQLAKELAMCRHQAREQVIIAVRTAETWEFDEPDLHKLRRRILLRLNRWLDAPLVEDVVLTEFRFRVD